jgi:hypothetical protein
VSVRSRVAFATGVAAAVGAALLLSGRFEGSVVLALLLAFSIRTASLAALVDAGPILAADALRGLRGRVWLAPVWALSAAAAIARAGSPALDGLRGANAVAGSALAYGPVITVVGSWLAFGAAILALITWVELGAETTGAAPGRVKAPSQVRRLDAIGVLAEAALVVSLFLGPQIVDGSDAAWWVGGMIPLAVAAWYARRIRLPDIAYLPALPASLAAMGLGLVLVGGAP